MEVPYLLNQTFSLIRIIFIAVIGTTTCWALSLCQVLSCDIGKFIKVKWFSFFFLTMWLGMRDATNIICSLPGIEPVDLCPLQWKCGFSTVDHHGIPKSEHLILQPPYKVNDVAFILQARKLMLKCLCNLLCSWPLVSYCFLYTCNWRYLGSLGAL